MEPRNGYLSGGPPTFQIVKRGSTMFAGGNRWERELPDGHFDTKPTGRDIVYRVYALLDPPVWEIAECIDIE